MSSPIIVNPTTTRDPWKLLGEEVTPLALGSETGSYEIFRQAGAEGSGAPPHHHPWDEAFFVISGEVTIMVGGDEVVATSGSFVHVPGGTVHAFRFGQTGDMVSMTSRAGASDFFAQVDAEVSPVDPDFPALVGIATTHGITVIPPPA